MHKIKGCTYETFNFDPSLPVVPLYDEQWNFHVLRNSFELIPPVQRFNYRD